MMSFTDDPSFDWQVVLRCADAETGILQVSGRVHVESGGAKSP
ncbi:hypothetical protein Z947_4155 [Sulfitobacter geojensis]|nr:hypothetical protein Z947_4155 [Sulfitobacter geojensis]